MTIIVLWILLALIALVVILLHFSVYAYVRLDDDGFFVRVKYLFFTIYPREKKEKEVKEKKTNEKRTVVEKEKTAEVSKQDFKDNIDDDFEEKKTETIVKEQAKEEKVLIEPEQKKDKTVVNKQVKKIEKEPEQTEKPKKQSKLQELKEKYYKIKPYLPMGWKYFKKLLKAIRITDLKINIDVGREDAHEAVIYYGSVQGVLFNTLAVLASIFTMKIKRANVNCIFAKNIVDGNGECYIRVRPSTIIAIAFCVVVNFGITYLKQRKFKKSENDMTENKLEVS